MRMNFFFTSNWYGVSWMQHSIAIHKVHMCGRRMLSCWYNISSFTVRPDGAISEEIPRCSPWSPSDTCGTACELSSEKYDVLCSIGLDEIYILWIEIDYSRSIVPISIGAYRECWDTWCFLVMWQRIHSCGILLPENYPELWGLKDVCSYESVK